MGLLAGVTSLRGFALALTPSERVFEDPCHFGHLLRLRHLALLAPLPLQHLFEGLRRPYALLRLSLPRGLLLEGTGRLLGVPRLELPQVLALEQRLDPLER